MEMSFTKKIRKIHEKKPVILNLTNHVTMEFVANTLLAVGTSPIMTESEDELEELTRIADAIYINIGTLNTHFIDQAQAVMRYADQYNKTIILDPVGAGASQLRTKAAKTLLPNASIIKANASELLAICDSQYQTKGVDALHHTADAAELAKKLALDQKCIVVVSGQDDLITDGIKHADVHYGSKLMSLNTGMGCALGGIISAFTSVCENFDAAKLATTYFGFCGYKAMQVTTSPASFKLHFIDILFHSDTAHELDSIFQSQSEELS